MSPTDPITERPAAAIAAAIAAGDCSALDAVNAHITRIERINPRLNAVVVPRFDEARAEARDIDRRRAAGEPLGPLAGVPITIKECLDLAGTPSTFGIPARRSHRAGSDDPAVARLRDAGAVILGKTNVAQLLLYYEGDNPVYGRTVNPWNAERSCGGSSGGEGAIIAARGSALGLGTDIGGSVRIPAAWCGIASLKPTAGRADDPGRYSVPYGQRTVVSQLGILARTVADVALGTRVLTGHATVSGMPLAPIGDHAAVDVRQLRVGCFTSFEPFPASPAAQRAVREAAAHLRAAGATVVDFAPPDLARAEDLFFRVLTAGGGAWIPRLLAGGKATPPVAAIRGVVAATMLTRGLLAHLLSALGQKSLGGFAAHVPPNDIGDHWRVIEDILDYRDAFQSAMAKASGGPLHAVLSPPSPLPPYRHDGARDLGTAGPYTVLYNLLGFPAGVVPVTRVRPGEEGDRAPSGDIVIKAARATEQGSAGLPVGAMVGAMPWREDVALAVMAAIEAGARTGADFPLRPPID